MHCESLHLLEGTESFMEMSMEKAATEQVAVPSCRPKCSESLMSQSYLLSSLDHPRAQHLTEISALLQKEQSHTFSI